MSVTLADNTLNASHRKFAIMSNFYSLEGHTNRVVLPEALLNNSAPKWSLMSVRERKEEDGIGITSRQLQPPDINSIGYLRGRIARSSANENAERKCTIVDYAAKVELG